MSVECEPHRPQKCWWPVWKDPNYNCQTRWGTLNSEDSIFHLVISTYNTWALTECLLG